MFALDLERGNFSLKRLYKNRVVRLLPNLLLMIVITANIFYDAQCHSHLNGKVLYLNNIHISPTDTALLVSMIEASL